MADIDSLELQIKSDSNNAKAGLDALITTLGQLKVATKGGCGLSSIAKPLGNIASAASKLNGSEGAKIAGLAKGLQALSNLGNLKLSSSVAHQISAMGAAVNSLSGVNFSKLHDLGTALQSVTSLGKSNLGSTINQINKLPSMMTALSQVDMTQLKTKLAEVTAAMKPLADEMQKVANGFSAFPTKIQQYLNASSKVPSSNKASALSFANLAAKVTAFAYILRRAARVVAGWINKSNDYIENVNLFSVAMGEYAESAFQYAQVVSEVMGIDPSDWMRNQGVFMSLATSFGVTTDRAATMSQQLTQLGYDIASFRNISVEEAMTKLTSGLAGEIEPLRAIGIDLSQARLEAIALSLGIDKTVSSMTQAEKAQLRYYAIMTLSTQAQGDMARTLNAPANQLRVLQAQVTQCARALGNIFIPALNAVLPVVIAVVKVITTLANVIAKLFGGTGFEGDIFSSGSGGLASGAEDASDAIDGATGSAKKLRKVLLGIDELNVMPEATSGGGGGGIGGGGGGFDFELPTYDFISEEVKNRVNDIVERMKEWLGLNQEINSWSDFFNTRLGNILIVVGAIGAGIAAWKISTGLITSLATIKEAAATLGSTNLLTGLGGGILALTGGVIEFAGIKDALVNGLDGFNFAEIFAGGGGVTAGGALIGKSLGSALLGGASGAVVGGLPAFIMGMYDSIKNGIDWLSSALTAGGGAAVGFGATALSASIFGTSLSPGWGTLIGLAVGLLADLIILVVQKWDQISAWLATAWQAISQFFVNAWSAVVGVWSTVATWYDTTVVQPILSFFEGMWSGIVSFASACWSGIVDFFSPAVTWFSKLFGSVYDTLSDIFYNIGVIASGCWEIITVVWGIVSTWFNDTVIVPVRTFFTNLWNTIKTAAINAWNGIKTVYSMVTSWISTTIIQPVSSFFSNLWSGFLEKARTAWEGVKTIFGNVASFFHDTFQKAWAGIVKVFSVAGEIFVDIKDGIVAAFKVVVNGIIRGINKVVAVPFNALNTALRKLKNTSILGLTPFSGIRTVSVPSIPLLASGGVIDGSQAGQLFVAREAGPELVANVGRKTAVMNNDQIVDSVSRGVYQAVVAAMGASKGDQVVEAKVNDKVLFEVLVSRARQETMRTGFNPLLGGV